MPLPAFTAPAPAGLAEHAPRRGALLLRLRFNDSPVAALVGLLALPPGAGLFGAGLRGFPLTLREALRETQRALRSHELVREEEQLFVAPALSLPLSLPLGLPLLAH